MRTSSSPRSEGNAGAGPRPETVDVVPKAANSENGLETSSFTVTARIRPMLAHEGKGGEHFTAIVPGLRSVGKGDEHSEEALCSNQR